jgi:hypothetical protein
MTNEKQQNCANHTVIPKTLIYAAVPMLLGAILGLAGVFMKDPSARITVMGIGAAILGAACIYGLTLTRIYATTLQDRIIRLEMRVRLREILPPEMQTDIPKLSMKQLIGLRFASDAEMPELARKVLSDRLDRPKPIKQLVKDWQADWERV